MKEQYLKRLVCKTARTLGYEPNCIVERHKDGGSLQLKVLANGVVGHKEETHISCVQRRLGSLCALKFPLNRTEPILGKLILANDV